MVAGAAAGPLAGRQTVTTVDPDQARQLLEHELQRSEYAGAQATWWDRASKAFFDWLGSLRPGTVDSPTFGTTLLWIAVAVLVAVVVLVVVTRGLPRRRARTARDGVGGVFEDDDARSAADLLRSAESAARGGDWRTAVLDGYRATARGLGERDLVADVPGATARAIAVRAARPFPTLADDLDAAASAFDDVRYLDRPADRAAADTVLGTARAVTNTRPVSERVEREPAVPA